MSTNSAHKLTPTTAEVRAMYVTGTPPHRVSIEAGNAEFDRWLAAHDAEVRRRLPVDGLMERAVTEAARNAVGWSALSAGDRTSYQDAQQYLREVAQVAAHAVIREITRPTDSDA